MKRKKWNLRSSCDQTYKWFKLLPTFLSFTEPLYSWFVTWNETEERWHEDQERRKGEKERVGRKERRMREEEEGRKKSERRGKDEIIRPSLQLPCVREYNFWIKNAKKVACSTFSKIQSFVLSYFFVNPSFPLFTSLPLSRSFFLSPSLYLILVLVLPHSEKREREGKSPSRLRFPSVILRSTLDHTSDPRILLFPPPLSPDYSFLLSPRFPHSHIAPVTNRKICVPSAVLFFSNQDWLTDGLIFKGLIYKEPFTMFPSLLQHSKIFVPLFQSYNFRGWKLPNLPIFPISQFLEGGRWALNGTDNDPIVNLNSL